MSTQIYWFSQNPNTEQTFHTEKPYVSLADFEAAQAALKQAVEALESIVTAEPKPIDDPFPADWEEQIKTCPECQGWAKNHPIQNGICDLHRKPIWERERREKNARSFLPLDMKDIARVALAAQPHLPAQREA